MYDVSHLCWYALKSSAETLANITDLVMGVAHIYQGSGTRLSTALSANLDTSYFSISLSLNILLTLMIVARLIVHIRNVRKAIGASEGARGLYSTTATVVTMLIESYALYAVIFLLYIVCWAIDNWAFSIFSNALGASQVCIAFTSPGSTAFKDVAF